MNKPPRKRTDHLLTKKLIWKAFSWYGLIASVISIGAYFVINYSDGWLTIPLASTGKTYVMATTMTLAAIVFSQIGAVFNCRAEKESLFKIGFFSNKRVLLGIFFEICLLAALINIPFLQDAFNTTNIPLIAWFGLALIPIPIILLEELRKAILRHRTLVK